MRPQTMRIQNNKYRQNALIFYGPENFCKPKNKPSIDDSTKNLATNWVRIVNFMELSDECRQ